MAKTLSSNPTIAKNPFIKRYNFILRQHNAIRAKMAMRKDETQKRAFMKQSWYKKRLDIILAMIAGFDAMIEADPDLYKEAIAICKDPRDYKNKQIDGKAFDLAVEYENLKGFYVEPKVKKSKKSTEKEVKDNG